MDPNTPDPQQQPQQQSQQTPLSNKPQQVPLTHPHQQLPQPHQQPQHYPQATYPDPNTYYSYRPPPQYSNYYSPIPPWNPHTNYQMPTAAQPMPQIVPAPIHPFKSNAASINHNSNADSQTKPVKTKKLAILKDPESGKVIDLVEESNSANKSNPSDKVTQPSTTKPTPTGATTKSVSSTTTNSVEQQLLKKVSEENTNSVEQQLLKKVSEDKDNKNDAPISAGQPKQSPPQAQNHQEHKEDNKENEPAIVPEVKSEDPTKVEQPKEQQQPQQQHHNEVSEEVKTSDDIVTKKPDLHHGKKVYSIEFLKEIGGKIKQDEVNTYNHSLFEQIDLFMPFNHNARYAGRPIDQSYGGRSSGGPEKKKKIIATASLGQDVELKTTENPWKPSVAAKDDKSADEVESEAIKKKFRSILNKLTPNNFDKLASAVTELNINTESKLGDVIDLVFAKALSEPGYCVLYGQMCSHLKKISAGAANFGNTLLRRCQNQFQSDPYVGLNLTEREEKIENETDPDVKKQLQEELYEDKFKCRMRSLGLIKFIGELYKIEMLNENIMFDCVWRLLNDPNEESLECLCDLLATIGEKLDNSTKASNNSADKDKKNYQQQQRGGANQKTKAYQQGNKSIAAIVASGNQNANSSTSANASNNNSQDKSQTVVPYTLDTVFEQMHKIRKNKDSDLPVRIKFKILDTCDLREKHHWHSKKTSAAPQKIEEIREAHKEKLEQERKQNALGPRRSQEGRRGLGHSGGSSNQLSSLGGEHRQGAMHTSASSGGLLGNDSMRTNHSEIESQKTFSRNLDALNKFMSGSAVSRNKDSPLRPMSSLRPQLGLRKPAAPVTSSSATPEAQGAATASAASNTTTTTSSPSKEN